MLVLMNVQSTKFRIIMETLFIGNNINRENMTKQIQNIMSKRKTKLITLGTEILI